MLLTQLRNLLAVVDSGSIRGAARNLSVSQPALTRSLRQLETELRVKLLERTARGVAPTIAGRAFIARSRVIHNELGRAKEELAQLAGEDRGSVAFGVGPHGAMHVVPPALAQFRRAHANTEVRIAEGPSDVLLPRLRQGSLDFAIGGRPQGHLDPGIKASPLHLFQLLVGARKGHPLRNTRSLRELVDASWVIYTPAGWSGAIVPDVFEKNGLPSPKSVVRSESYVAMLTIIARTDTLGALGSRVFEQQIAQEFIQPLKLKERLPEITHYLFTRADSPLTPVAGAMVAAITAVARQ